MRTVQSIDDGWQFVRDDVGLEAARSGPGDWTDVALPHTWNAEDGHTGGNDYHRGSCWYRRDLDVGALTDGRRAFVEFGAAGMVADVHVGDTAVGTHRGGYSIFRAEVTDALDASGQGRLSVRVDNGTNDDVYPLLGDHTFFGGLYRSARLITTSAVHFDPLDHGSPGVLLTQQSLDDQSGVISVRARVTNDADEAIESAVTARAVDDGREVAASSAPVTVEAGETTEVDLTLTVENPHRWDGKDDPHLYEVVVTISGPADGEPADEVALPFGLRTFEVDPETGPRLNGRSFFLAGASRHHDFEGKGPALSPADHETDLALFKELGVTAIRLAHYQHDQYFYDLCDRAGIAVWAEIPFNAQAALEDPDTNAVAQMTDLVLQNAHHPSILCWGVQNEITLGEARQDPRPTVERLSALVKSIDPSRPTTQANLGQVAGSDPIINLTDLNAMNLYWGWYYGAARDIGPTLDDLHAANPNVPLGLSEYGADTFVGYHATEPTAGDYTEEYQCVLHEEYWRAVTDRPYMWSSFVWNMFDFASDLRREGGKAGRNMKGLVTYDRKTRKDAFYWYKANWSTEPFVHICSKRFVNRHEAAVTIKAYSNLDAVSLEVNGEDIGNGTGPDRVFTWDIELGSGTTTVRAVTTGPDGTSTDTAEFQLVDEPDESYVCPEPATFGAGEAAGQRESWFEKEGLEADPSIYSTWSTIAELVENPETHAVLVDTFGPEMLEDPRMEMAGAFTVDFIIPFLPTEVSDEELRALHDRLSVIPKPST